MTYIQVGDKKNLDKSAVTKNLKYDLNKSGRYSEANLSVNKGFFVYYAVEGSYEGGDYPVGYEGEAHMGDYYRFLMPTIYGCVEDFPEPLRRGIAVSDTVDFTKDHVRQSFD